MSRDRRRLSRIVLLAGAFALRTALAGGDTPEQEYLGEVPTVLTASRLLQPISEAPVVVTIIDRETIEASGSRNVTDVLRLVPGMYVRPGIGIEGVVPVVSYHGLTNEFARRMQVLIDGRSVYLPPFSTVLWDDLPLAIDDIDHIEVARGPNAASYGANAFFGTINIVTRTPVGSEGAYALVRGGSDGVRDAIVRESGGSGQLQYRATLGHKADDGFPALYDSQHHDFLTAQAEQTLNASNSLEVQIGYSAGQRQLGVTSNAINRPRSKNVEDGYLQLRWQRIDAPNNELSVQYYYEQHSATEADLTLPMALPGAPLQSYLVRADYRFDRHDVELVRMFEPMPQLRMIFGAGARIEQVAAPIYFGGRPDLASNLERVFAHGEWRSTPSLLLQAGAMLERTSISGTDLSPRVSATYHLDARQSLTASLSRATRTPSLFEAQGNFVLNFGANPYPVQASGGDVRAEQIISTALSYHAGSADGRSQVDVKIYRDHAMNLIEEYANPQAPYLFGPLNLLKNLDDVHVRGAEIELHYQPQSHARYVLAYSTTLLSNSVVSQLRTMPRNILSALAQWDVDTRWSAGLAVYANSSLPSLTGVFGQRDDVAVGFQCRIDAHVTRKLRLWERKGTIAVGVQDARAGFVEFRPDTTMQRRVYLEASIGL